MKVNNINKYIKILSIGNINIIFYKNSINLIYDTIDKIIYTTNTNINKNSIMEYIENNIPNYKILFTNDLNNIKLNININ